jgi:hypothetical protein
MERSWVYTHAIELGAVKLGSGAKPRLRFDPQVATRALHKIGEAPAAEIQRAGAAAPDQGQWGELTSGVVSSREARWHGERQGRWSSWSDREVAPSPFASAPTASAAT